MPSQPISGDRFGNFPTSGFYDTDFREVFYGVLRPVTDSQTHSPLRLLMNVKTALVASSHGLNIE